MPLLISSVITSPRPGRKARSRCHIITRTSRSLLPPTFLHELAREHFIDSSFFIVFFFKSDLPQEKITFVWFNRDVLRSLCSDKVQYTWATMWYYANCLWFSMNSSTRRWIWASSLTQGDSRIKQPGCTRSCCGRSIGNSHEGSTHRAYQDSFWDCLSSYVLQVTEQRTDL